MEFGGFMRARRCWQGRQFYFEVGEEGKWYSRRYLFHCHVFLLVDTPEQPDQLWKDIRSFWTKNDLPFDEGQSLKWMWHRSRGRRSISGWHDYIQKRDPDPIVQYSDYVFECREWPVRKWFGVF